LGYRNVSLAIDEVLAVGVAVRHSADALRRSDGEI
jgi:hypothetical protein